ncbi:GNAT family N-acetyltransferase [Companilactobacillus hulinensis]|uniref:GNAT family N-acetyltransferase n=1 Tax=Companilactobacillus hulinensis TaxID=2486007 RepID=UPI000F78B0E3|nr:GNAT family N-acetyltransferase [Companilactobacillus hulinensis]
MKNIGTVKLETKRLILRRLSPSDADEMYHNWASDPEVTKYLTWPTYDSIDQAYEFLKYRTESYQNPCTYDWGIVVKETNDLIGTISAVDFSGKINSVEIGYAIGSKWWRNGYMTEALKKVIDFFFTETDVNRIEACYDSDNPNSGKVMHKSGMSFEGVMRSKGYNNNGICDEVVYSILRGEY